MHMFSLQFNIFILMLSFILLIWFIENPIAQKLTFCIKNWKLRDFASIRKNNSNQIFEIIDIYHLAWSKFFIYYNFTKQGLHIDYQLIFNEGIKPVKMVFIHFEASLEMSNVQISQNWDTQTLILDMSRHVKNSSKDMSK